MHNFAVVDFDGDGDDELIAASREGVHLLRARPRGAWTRTRIGEGPPARSRWDASAAAGRSRPSSRGTATRSSIYREPAGAPRSLWTRHVIDETLTGGHAIGWADIDRDGEDELIAGWRDKEGGVALYARRVRRARPPGR